MEQEGRSNVKMKYQEGTSFEFEKDRRTRSLDSQLKAEDKSKEIFIINRIEGRSNVKMKYQEGTSIEFDKDGRTRSLDSQSCNLKTKV